MAAIIQAHAATDVVIREIERPAEIRAVEELQKEVRGLPDLDVVPYTQLIAAKAAGGALLGAFDNAVLVGFVYGFAGCEDGIMTHHSHMLAVKPGYRNLNLGYRLKLAQRDLVLSQGITEMTWTFDPLQSLNAYFNFGRLGVISDRYLIDFYGTDAASFLHQNGTDRLWVTWRLASRRVVERLDSDQDDLEPGSVTALVEFGHGDAPTSNEIDLENAGDRISVEIPADVRSIEQEDPAIAAAWRHATRAAFTEAISAGYIATEFVPGTKAGKYTLRRGQDTRTGSV